jgi:hypothetical protein
MTTKVLYGLIILTSVLLTVANIVLQEYLFAGVAIVSGVIWLLLQIKEQEPPHSFFFVLFLGLAILGSLHHISIPFMLLVLSSDLAAWDLSRFLARISQEEESASKTLMESKHLQKLAFTLAIGFLVALLPTFVHISLNFVVFLVMLFLLMLTLRKSIHYLRTEADIKN